MVEPPVLLTALSEDQRAQAHTRFSIIRPALEDGVSQVQVARTHDISKSTIVRWVKRYREHGLTGLADRSARSDKGTSRRLPTDAVTLIEGLALQTPPRTISAIHRQVCTIAKDRGWNVPSYDSVSRIIKKLDPALLLLAHQGAAAYCEEYDLLYRREAVGPTCPPDPPASPPAVPVGSPAATLRTSGAQQDDRSGWLPR